MSDNKNEKKSKKTSLTLKEGPITSFEELRQFKRTVSTINRRSKLKQYKKEIKKLQKKEEELTKKIEELNQEELIRTRAVVRGQITRTKKKLEALNESSS